MMTRSTRRRSASREQVREVGRDRLASRVILHLVVLHIERSATIQEGVPIGLIRMLQPERRRVPARWRAPTQSSGSIGQPGSFHEPGSPADSVAVVSRPVAVDGEVHAIRSGGRSDRLQHLRHDQKVHRQQPSAALVVCVDRYQRAHGEVGILDRHQADFLHLAADDLRTGAGGGSTTYRPSAKKCSLTGRTVVPQAFRAHPGVTVVHHRDQPHDPHLHLVARRPGSAASSASSARSNCARVIV